MPIEFTIHVATENDFEDMLRLNKDLFSYEKEQGFSDVYSQEWTYSEDGRRVFRTYFEKEDARAWIAANENGDAVGYLAAVFKNLPYRDPTSLVEIEMIYLDESYRCSGIGRTLIEEVKSWAKGMDAATIRVGALAANRHARDFYEKWGFKEAEVIYEMTEKVGRTSS